MQFLTRSHYFLAYLFYSSAARRLELNALEAQHTIWTGKLALATKRMKEAQYNMARASGELSRPHTVEDREEIQDRWTTCEEHYLEHEREFELAERRLQKIEPGIEWLKASLRQETDSPERPEPLPLVPRFVDPPDADYE